MKFVVRSMRGLGTCRALFLSSAAFLANSAAQASPKAGPKTPSKESSSAPAKEGEQAPTKEQCIDAHRQAQRLQNATKLVEARELARTCTALTCPGMMISDCARWLSDLDQRIPTVVFEVRQDGEPNLSAVAYADGTRVEEWTRGESLSLNPGEHEFRFELAPYQPITKKMLLAEGMRFRVLSIEFKTEAPPAAAAAAAPTTEPTAPTAPAAPKPAVPTVVVEPLPAPAPPRIRPTPTIVYPLLGLGAVGIGGFTALALVGKSKQSSLESSCEPHCTTNDLKPMKTAYLLGDISLGVGAASLIAAGVLYLGRPEKPMAARFDVVPVHGGATTTAVFHF